MTTTELPAKYDNIPTVEEGPPMKTGSEGVTPLMYACQQAREHEVRSILRKKPNCVRDRDRTMKTALHYCAENTTLSCADLVLSSAPDLLDARDEDGYTPLHLAVISGNKALLKYLLGKKADVNSLDNERHSVVHWATVCGEVEALDILLDAGADPSTPDIHGGYPIHYAAQMCGPNSEMGNDVRVGLSVLRKLLARGVEVNVTDQDGRQPILWAASAGSADAMLALVNAGANVEADDKDGLTALHCAASRGHTDCLETLVTLCGAEVDVIDSNGCTALFYAVTLGHADSTELLLGYGAEPNRQDRKGRTPAHCGAAKGQLETLKLLSKHGANLWMRNVRGDLPLHEGVQSGRKELVRWLLTQRPETVNSPNNDGRCPLHIAAINNNVEMCKILIDSNALVNPLMRNSKGQMMTPLDAALYRGNRGCAKYLQLHGGVPSSKLNDKNANQRGIRRVVTESQASVSSDRMTTPEGFLAAESVPGISPRVPMSGVSSPTGDAGGDQHTHRTGQDPDTAIQHVERIDVARQEMEMELEKSMDGLEERRQRRSRPRRISDKREEEAEEEEEEESVGEGKNRRDRRKWRGDTRARTESEDSEFVEEEDEKEVASRRRRRRKGKYRTVRRNRKSEEGYSESEVDRDKESDVENKQRFSDRKRRSEKSYTNRSKRRDKDSEIDDSETNYEDILEEHERRRKGRRKRSAKRKRAAGLKKTSQKDKSEENYPDESIEEDEQVLHVKEGEKELKENAGEEEVCQKEDEVLRKKSAEVRQEDEKEVLEVKSELEENTVTNDNNEAVNEKKEEDTNEEKPSPAISIASGSSEATSLLNESRQGIAWVIGETEAKEIRKAVKRERSVKEKKLKSAKQKTVKVEQPKRKIKDKKSVQQKEKAPSVVTKKITAKRKEKKGENDENKKLTRNEKKKAEKVESETATLESEKTSQESRETDVDEKEKKEVCQEANEDEEKDDQFDDNLAEESRQEETKSSGEEVRETNGSRVSYVIAKDDDIIETPKEDGEKELVTEGENIVEEEKTSSAKSIKSSAKNKVKKERKKEDSNVLKEEKGNCPPLLELTDENGYLKDALAEAEEMELSGQSSIRSQNGVDSGVMDSSLEAPKAEITQEEKRRSAAKTKKGGVNTRKVRDLEAHELEEDAKKTREILERRKASISVTQAVQNSMRKYQLERRIFQELLELKRLQIRAGRANENMLVKRLVDEYKKAGLIVGLRQYDGPYTFRIFEKYLYDQLHLLQTSDTKVIPRLKPSDDLEKLSVTLRKSRSPFENVPDNPIQCTHGTHRCYHAAHAYTGIPCAAYITRLNHHQIPKTITARGFLPRIETKVSRNSPPRSLRYVDPAKPVTLELSHGGEKQIISLPTERLDKNKRYCVTFTIRPTEDQPPPEEPPGNIEEGEEPEEQDESNSFRHRHAKSL